MIANDPLAGLPWKSRSSVPVITKGEKILRTARHHWMKYVLPMCVYLLFFPLCIVLIVMAPALGSVTPELGLTLLMASLVAVVLVQHWFFHAMLSENVTDMMLTDKRILLLSHRLWLADGMDEIILNRIKMVEVDKHGFVRRLFDYGDLWFDVGGGRTLPYISSPHAWAGHVERVMNIR